VSLAEDGNALIEALEAYVKASEDRKEYRGGKGRTLSKEHIAALEAIRRRIGAVLRPEPVSADAEAVRALRAEFERISDRMGRTTE
jgi:hypothetical protein